MTQARIRKQVYLLRASDLTDYPIWEFCSDEEDEEGQDEATVRPSKDTEILGYSPGAYVVAADAVCNDGSRYSAYLYSGKPDDIGCVQPNLVLPSGQVNVWFGSLKYSGDPQSYVTESLAKLDKLRDEVFPIKFTTRVDENGARVTLSVDGFKARDEEDRVVTIG